MGETGQSLSTSLLVNCPPEFVNGPTEQQLDSKTVFHFPFKSYTEIIRCQVFEVASSDIFDCTEPNMMIGHMPHFEVRIEMTRGKTDELRQWRLELSNDFGSDHVQFSGGYPADTKPTTEIDTSVTPPVGESASTGSFATTPFGIFTISVNLGIIATIVTMIVYFQRGKLTFFLQ
ncbi:uncharacterized protein [Littorina saxatilis]|uniref:uncharacterized protein n=1 Tax=Littorina saxatilis TaxID=31220 RepID=UPI0038B552CA